MSNSTTQSYRQHRFLMRAIACFADRPGRYPYESGWKIGSRISSMIRLTTVCAIRSDTVGIPSFLVPPVAFGISTCFTGGGKYDPDAMRFHSLYKLLDRSGLGSQVNPRKLPQRRRAPQRGVVVRGSARHRCFGEVNICNSEGKRRRTKL